MVFDESIRHGGGGGCCGKKLKALARSQVLCRYASPQIAAFADQHT